MMMHKLRSVLANILLLLVLVPASSLAAVNVNGKSTISYEPGVFGSKPSDDSKRDAMSSAKRAAWEKYTQGFSPSKMKSYRQIESSLLNDIDNYIIETSVIDEKTDESSKRYTVVVRVTINEQKFNAKLSEISNAGSTRSGSGSLFSFIFVAREEDSVKKFDERRTEIEMSEGKSFENEGGTQNANDYLGTHEYKKVAKNTSGGSVLKKSDQVSYRILSSDEINTSMNEVLTASGFEVVDYEDVVSECGGTEPRDIKNEFTTNNEISRPARKDAISGSRTCDVSYFAVGTLDVGLPETDPVTGNLRAYVSVKAQVWNIDKRLPRKIASVGPVQYQGLGPNARVAQTNALNQSAKNVANEIVNQLNAKELY